MAALKLIHNTLKEPLQKSVMMVSDAVLWLLIFTLLALCASGKDNEVSPRLCGGAVRHVHLAVGPNPSREMIVSFASIPSKYQAPIAGVLVGLSPNSLGTAHMETEVANAYNLTVPTRRANDGSTYFSPYYHHITVTGLQPSTRYYYKPIVHTHLRSFSKYNLKRTGNKPITQNEMLEVFEESEPEDEIIVNEGQFRHRDLERLFPYDGSKNQCPSPDKIRSFRTAPAPVTPGDDSTITPVTFAIIGDLGQYPHSELTLARLIRSRDEVDTIILAGDIAYPNGDHRQWDTFFDFLDDYPIADHKPMQIVPGNHDIDKSKDGKEIFLAYEHRFRMPRVHPPKLGIYDGPPGYLNMDIPPYPLDYEWGNAYYAYTYGPARMVMISSYSSMEPGSTQYDWIVHELSTVDRKVTPWVLVVLHTPLYNTFALHRKDEQIAAAKKNLEPVFVKHQVNMVFSGHIHAYLRTANVVMGETDPTGPIHITVGAGGRKCEAPFYSEEPEPWVEVRDATIYGYGMFRIVNRTHAQWDWIHTGTADDHDRNVVFKSDTTLPAGPALDRVLIANQYFR
jgi:hypothetical protein